MTNQNQPPPLTINTIDWENWNYTHHAVVCFIRQFSAQGSPDKILLIHKKTGLGKGKISAPGGKLEAGETPQEAAIREVQEEVGLTPSALEKVADLHFIFKDGYSMRGYAFLATQHTGELITTREADPFWQSEKKIPYDKMWADDIEWLPQVLTGKKAIGHFLFDQDTLIEKKVIIHS